MNGLEVMLEDVANDVSRIADALELLAALTYFHNVPRHEGLWNHPSLQSAHRLGELGGRQSRAKGGDDGE